MEQCQFKFAVLSISIHNKHRSVNLIKIKFSSFVVLFLRSVIRDTRQYHDPERTNIIPSTLWTPQLLAAPLYTPGRLLQTPTSVQCILECLVVQWPPARCPTHNARTRLPGRAAPTSGNNCLFPAVFNGRGSLKPGGQGCGPPAAAGQQLQGRSSSSWQQQPSS